MEESTAKDALELMLLLQQHGSNHLQLAKVQLDEGIGGFDTSPACKRRRGDHAGFVVVDPAESPRKDVLSTQFFGKKYDISTGSTAEVKDN